MVKAMDDLCLFPAELVFTALQGPGNPLRLKPRNWELCTAHNPSWMCLHLTAPH